MTTDLRHRIFSSAVDTTDRTNSSEIKYHVINKKFIIVFYNNLFSGLILDVKSLVLLNSDSF